MKSPLLHKAVAWAAACGIAISGAFFVGTAQAEENTATATEKEFTGYLDWGWKDSFRNYLSMPFAHGSFSASNGASVDSNNISRYPMSAGQKYGMPSELSFDGTVTAVAHEGVLEIQIEKPKVVMDYSTMSATLNATMRSREFKGMSLQDKGDLVDYGTITLAKMAMNGRPARNADGSMTMNFTNVLLTEDGAKGFGGFYHAGDELSDLSVTYSAKEVPVSEPEPSDQPDPSVEPSDPDQPADPDQGATGENDGDHSGAATDNSDKPATGENTTPSVQPAPVEGTMAWNIKDSWVKYVTFAKAVVTPQEGASVSEDFSLTYPVAEGATYAPGSNEKKVDFAGSVNFSAHGGVMDITLAHPQLVSINKETYVYFDVTSKGMDGKVTSAPHMQLLKLSNYEYFEGEGGTHNLKYNTVRFASNEAGALFGRYTSETELSPVFFSFAFAKQTEKPSTGDNTNTPVPGNDNKDSGETPVTQPSTDQKPAHEQKKECTIDPNRLRATSGSLSWGIRSSFTTYIRGSIAHGDWSLNGASWNGSQFGFALRGGLYNTQTATGYLYFAGSVHFTGHDGKLDVTLANPYIAINGNTGTLYAYLDSSDMSGNKVGVGTVALAQVNFATVNASKTSLALSTSSVSLTAEGAKAFAGFYQAGEALDNFTAQATLTYATSCDKDGNLIEYDAFGSVTKGGLASTGAGVDSLIAGALFLILAGSFAARTRTRSGVKH